MQAANKQDRQYTYERKFEARSPNHYFRGKAITIIHFERVCGLIYPAMRLRLIVLSSVICPNVPYFSTSSHKRQHFRKNAIEHKICVLIFPTTFRTVFHSSEESSEMLT